MRRPKSLCQSSTRLAVWLQKTTKTTSHFWPSFIKMTHHFPPQIQSSLIQVTSRFVSAIKMTSRVQPRSHHFTCVKNDTSFVLFLKITRHFDLVCTLACCVCCVSHYRLPPVQFNQTIDRFRSSTFTGQFSTIWTSFLLSRTGSLGFQLS